MSILCLIISGGILLAAPNPVAHDVADAGVLRHAGKYYLMGVHTSGGMHVSDDLVHWSDPTHVFSMNNTWATGSAGADSEIHACDMVLRNGIFHLYWSVNYQELRQIGHAIAETPLGPYHEPVTDRPFDGRIDPQCFQDDGGKLYFYTVKFDVGNIIWGQLMNSPWELAGAPKRMLGALSNTWESLDTSEAGMSLLINEGPFVTKYHDRYYMIYNANHTSRKYGNYAFGVAEADAPLNFTNNTKYPFPVLCSNRDPKHEGIATETAQHEVKNCGQPNLVRGPNGFEWWLVYFADFPRRSQCIDRVHFFGREMYIEGPTLPSTPGYHPAPAMPAFRDLFEGKEPLAAHWRTEGAYRKKKGMLRASSESTPAFARAITAPARNYLIETTLQYQGAGTGRLGAIAWENQEGAAIHIGLDREKNTAFFAMNTDKGKSEQSVALARDFNWRGPHALRIESNEGAFTIFLDEILLDMPDVHLSECTPGCTGLFADGCSASADCFAIACGWDEWGKEIRGWNDSAGHLVHGGADGIALPPDTSVFKGDPLPQYEFTAQIQENGDGGVYPVYVDAANYLQIWADANFSRLYVNGKREGESMQELSFPVKPRIHRAHSASVNGNNLRAVKLKDRIILFAEGYEAGEVPGHWPASRVGLFAREAPCRFDGLTLYQL